MVVMKDSFEAGLRMLSDIARRPTFAPAEIDRQRQQMLSSLKVSFEDPEFIANAVFRPARSTASIRYGMPQTGNARDDRGHHARRSRRRFTGGISCRTTPSWRSSATSPTEEAFEGVKSVFGDWERRDGAGLIRSSPPPDPDAPRRSSINKPDAVQTEVRVGHIWAFARNHPDYMAAQPGDQDSRRRGRQPLAPGAAGPSADLTYGAQADIDTLKESGDIEASTNTRSDATGEVLRLMVDEFWRLQRERVSERELSDAKAYLTGSFPLTIETPDAIATQVLNVLFYGLPVEELRIVPPAGQRRRRSTISSACRSSYLRPRPAGDRSGGQCGRVHIAASTGRFRRVRSHRHGRPGSHGRRLQRRGTPGDEDRATNSSSFSVLSCVVLSRRAIRTGTADAATTREPSAVAAMRAS